MVGAADPLAPSQHAGRGLASGDDMATERPAVHPDGHTGTPVAWPSAVAPDQTNGGGVRPPQPVMGTSGPAAHGPLIAPGHNGHDRGTPCTAPQLRRFIKSRPYVPLHELRRRFAIDGTDDDVSPIELAPGRIFVGLPLREGQLLGELVRSGEIGYELSLDPRTPIVVGVYPMRPVPRP